MGGILPLTPRLSAVAHEDTVRPANRRRRNRISLSLRQNHISPKKYEVFSKFDFMLGRWGFTCQVSLYYSSDTLQRSSDLARELLWWQVLQHLKCADIKRYPVEKEDDTESVLRVTRRFFIHLLPQTLIQKCLDVNPRTSFDVGLWTTADTPMEGFVNTPHQTLWRESGFCLDPQMWQRVFSALTSSWSWINRDVGRVLILVERSVSRRWNCRRSIQSKLSCFFFFNLLSPCIRIQHSMYYYYCYDELTIYQSIGCFNSAGRNKTASGLWRTRHRSTETRAVRTRAVDVSWRFTNIHIEWRWMHTEQKLVEHRGPGGAEGREDFRKVPIR